MPPKKSKKDDPCYTKTSKSGKTYVTCEGAQKAKAKAKDKKPIPPNSVRAKSRRAAQARKLTTRPTGAGRIETGTLNKGKIIKETKAKAPVKEAKAKAPVKAKANKAKAVKPKPKVDKDLLQKVLPIMASVGKAKNAPQQLYELDSRNIYERGLNTLRREFREEGFKPLKPKDRSDFKVDNGDGEAVARMTDAQLKSFKYEFRYFLDDHGSRITKTTQKDIDFVITREKK